MIFGFRAFKLYLVHLDLMSADLEPIWGHLGRLLGPSWAILGPTGAQLGPIWGRPGAILGHPGAILGPSWASSASSGAKLCHLRATFHMNRPSWTHLGPCSNPFEPIWAHVRSHLGPSWALFGAILGPMLGHLLRSLQPRTTPQMLKEGAAVHRRRRLR